MSLWFHRLDKNTNEINSEFLPWNFYTFLGASWKLFGAFCRLPCLWYYIISPQGSPKSFHEAPRKLQKNSGQKSRNNFVSIFVQTMKPKGHFEINWPLEMSSLNISLVVFHCLISSVNHLTKAHWSQIIFEVRMTILFTLG